MPALFARRQRFALILALAGTLGVALGMATGLRAAAAPRAFSSAGNARPAAQSVVPEAMIPVLNFQSQDDVCRSWVAVQNVGSEATKAVFVGFGGFGMTPDCGTLCAPPTGVTCSGLIAPGSSWQFLGAQIPYKQVPGNYLGPASGIIFSFNARHLSELGATAPGDDLAADYLCHVLAAMTDCAAYALFKTAADNGGEFAGVSLARAAGSPLAVTVLRHCPGDRTPGVEVSAAYEAVTSPDLFEWTDPQGAYVSYIGPVAHQAPQRKSLLYIQNAGSGCARVELWFMAAARPCGQDLLCKTLAVAPGTAARVKVADCVGPDWAGTAWVKSDQPMALAADSLGQDVLATTTGVGAVAAHDVAGQPALAALVTVAYAPLVYPASDGWDTAISVQNLDHDRPGRARVTVQDADGAQVQVSEVDLCPHGLATIEVPKSGDGSTERPGSAVVESLAVNGQPAVPVHAVARLEDRKSSPPGTLAEAAEYGLLPDTLAYAAGGGAGATGGVGVIGIPSLIKDPRGTSVSTELAIQNLVPVAGDTDVAVLLYDANDLTQVLCRKIPAGGTAYVDLLNSEASVTEGFFGSAVVSATAWHHPDPTSGANRLGLAAVAVLRSGTRRGQDVPGDELAVISGFPLRRAPADVALSAGVCPSPPPPAPRPSGPADGPADGAVFLPAMADLGYNGRCQATLTATNSGAAPARAVAVVYGKPWFASPGCSGPTSVLCSGLLAPGETWQLGPDPSLADSFSAVVYGFNTRTLADLGLPGGDEAVADWLCRAGGLVGDCAAARQFQLAYSFGGVFKGIPMDRAYAAPIQASVTRQCPDAVQPTATNTSSYVGASGAAFDLTRPTAGGYHDSVATVKADADGLNTILYLQTAGLGTATIHIVFRPLGELAGGKQCFVFTLAPGEAFPWDSSDCIGPGFTGTAFITSTEPLAVMGETLGAGVQRTWLSHPTWNAYDLNDDGVVNLADEAVVAGALGAAPGNVRWNARTDFDHDLTVTDADRALFNLGGLGHPMPTPTSTPTHTAAPPSPPALYMPYANQPRP